MNHAEQTPAFRIGTTMTLQPEWWHQLTTYPGRGLETVFQPSLLPLYGYEGCKGHQMARILDDDLAGRLLMRIDSFEPAFAGSCWECGQRFILPVDNALCDSRRNAEM